MARMSSANPKIQEPSMEEILASIRRIIADDQDAARPAPPPEPAPSPVDDDVLDLADLAPPLPAAKLELEHEDVSFREDDNQIDFDSIGADEEFEISIPPPPPPAPPPPAQARAPAPAESLLSHAADASVTSAFGMLSSTVLSQSPRTLEDLVKDLLRPMLKAWLDDNLPPLVERLVRAEIERVARGGR
jgi:cell pole-organizing protein PopZ